MSDENKKVRSKWDGWLVAMGLSAGLLIWFAAANSGSVRIHFWVHTVRAPLIDVIVVAALLGALILGLWFKFRRRR